MYVLSVCPSLSHKMNSYGAHMVAFIDQLS